MKPEPCDANRLEAWLTGTLAKHDEIELTEHLDHCVHCVGQLEKQAADQSRWDDAKLLLGESCLPEIESSLDDHADRLPLPVRQVIEMMDPTDDPTYVGRVDGYEVLGVVGSGAMGVVLKVADKTLDRIVALKVMNPSLAACGTARQRFSREAKAAAGVLHPNVIAIHGVSTNHALPYLVMPYVRGTSLQQRLDRQGPLLLPELLRIGQQVAAGLAAAHQQGLIHRDIKPSNIMLDSGVETAVITDFGLARTIDDATMTRTGSITGTPEFMSPEQARGDAVNFRSDVFSLGSVLYALCTGQRPFRAKTSFGVLRKITDATPAPIREINSDIPVWFCDLVQRMHAKSPEERPKAAEVRDLLEGCLAHIYQPDRIPLPDGLSEPTRSDSRFNFRSAIFAHPFLFGVTSIMTITILTLLVAAMIPSSTTAIGDAGAADPPRQAANADEPTVFKTLKLSFPDPERTGKLVIDINRGFVEVAGHDQPGVIIEILNPPASAKSQDLNSELRTQFAPKFDLDRDKATNSIKLDTYNQSYVLNLRIKVPFNSDLSLDTYYDGYLQVKDVAGTIDTHSQNCDIRLLDIAGSATAYSYNGDFTIRFHEVASDAKLDFESYNGSIDLTLPDAIAATTAISSGRGTYASAFDIKPIADRDQATTKLPAKLGDNDGEYQLGTINSGGIPIRIESEKGKILLRKPSREKLKAND